MEQLNFARLDGNQVRILKLCTSVSSIINRSFYKEAEAKRKDFNVVRISLVKKIFSSELSKVIQERILWIRLYRTMY